MGYRGKLAEQQRARALRAEGMTLADIAVQLGVSKASVSTWVRDVPFTPSKRRYGPRLRPNKLMQRKAAQIAAMDELGQRRLGAIDEQAFLAAGAALYAGEGAKRDGQVVFANSDPRIIRFFISWLRYFFAVDESRLRLRLYIHEDQDVAAATTFWADLTGIPVNQHRSPYLAKADPTIRLTKHVRGCPSVILADSRLHREIMGLVHALLTCNLPSGVAQSAARLTVNQ